MPRSETHPYLCYFHGRRENLARAADSVGRQVSACFSGGYVTACDLSTAMAHVFAATARGEIKPRTAGILGYLGQTMVQTIPIAEREYIHTFGMNAWRVAVQYPFVPTSNPAASATPATGAQPSPAPDKPSEHAPATPQSTKVEPLPKDPAAFAKSILPNL